MNKKNLPNGILIKGNDDLGEFFQVDGELFSDVELLENLKKWREWEVPVIVDDWCNRILNEDETEILYFPTHEDKMDYIRVEKDLEPLHHTPNKPYATISKIEWLELLD
ncbi:hypothetical protein [Streptococcus equi]|uniref:hypothetical protein n=1 Tax=Streptococcus equi TaxID=1336 RepID=UPI002A78D186|nr:hypothetical protein [Streptococcus equi subsp. zooepidemicus]HEL0807279.1 hypothetical protein [Streptococcus equi subsp. zooepidemicus]HEL1072917.1 hypothetical protein [Streptococcus equi subsp. zooepidemicus]HEL1087632.1 hypothetical protein [Streptococcus equi subsp. zooepidemicus]HEL1116180.1 hypothetical protein [Streptococcus equi subsp. zooepidemicus]